VGPSAVAGVAFVATILLLPPVAASPQLGIVLKKPYSGTIFVTNSTSGNVGCRGVGSVFSMPAYFSLTRGRGGVAQVSRWY
jgi:hypothetical protein